MTSHRHGGRYRAALIVAVLWALAVAVATCSATTTTSRSVPEASR